jgi:hypothetical protein
MQNQIGLAADYAEGIDPENVILTGPARSYLRAKAGASAQPIDIIENEEKDS